MATAAGSNKGRTWFTAACGVLSRYVKQAAEKTAVAAEVAETEARSPALVVLPLMPGADVSPAQESGTSATPTSCASRAQMTVVYGGRALVLDDVPADKAAGLLQVAAAAATARGGAKAAGWPMVSTADLPVARKASLRRFMQKRNGRLVARAATMPYLRGPDVDGHRSACPDRLALALTPVASKRVMQ